MRKVLIIQENCQQEMWALVRKDLRYSLQGNASSANIVRPLLELK